MSKEVEELIKGLKDSHEEILKAHADAKGEFDRELQTLKDAFDKRIKEVETFVKDREISVDGVEKSKFSFARAIKAMAYKAAGKYNLNEAFKVAGAQYELDVFMASEETDVVEKKRAASSEVDSLGGFFVPTEVSQQIIDLAMPNIVTIAAGATVFNNVVGEFKLPKVTGRPTAYWLGEDEAFTESDTTFGEVAFRPKGLGAWSRINNSLLNQHGTQVDQYIMQEMANSMALKLDLGMLAGKGAEKEPKGIIRYNISAPTGVSAGDAATFDTAKAFVEDIDLKDQLDKPGGKYSFVCHPKHKWKILRQLSANYSGAGEAGSDPLFFALAQKDLEDALGYKFYSTTQMPEIDSNYPFLFGNWAKSVAAFWAGFEMKVSTEASHGSKSAWLQRQLWVAAFQDVDFNCLDETAFSKQNLANA